MNNSKLTKEQVIQGLCSKCFYLIYKEDNESFECDKYRMKLDGKVESCPGFMPISEGLDELMEKMMAQGELPEWVGSKNHIKQKEF